MSNSLQSHGLCSPPGSSAHGILQARTLEWAAILFSGDLPDPGIEHASPTLQADSLSRSHQGSPLNAGGELSFHFACLSCCFLFPCVDASWAAGPGWELQISTDIKQQRLSSSYCCRHTGCGLKEKTLNQFVSWRPRALGCLPFTTC